MLPSRGCVVVLAGAAGACGLPKAGVGVSELPANVRVESERIDVVCRDDPDEPRCRVKLTESVVNTSTDAHATGPIDVWASGDDAIAVRVEPPLVEGPSPDHATAPLTLAPSERRTLTLAVEASLHAKPSLWLVTPLLVARHPYLSSGRFDAKYYLTLDAAPNERGESHPTTLRVSVPADFAIETAPGKEWARSEHDGMHEARTDEPQTVAVAVPGRGIHHGGPVAGVGGATQVVGGGGRVAFDVGYEIAIPEWLIESVHVDLDDRRIDVAPTIEWAFLPTTLLLPGASLGAGAPIVLHGHGTVGFRAILGIQLPPNYIGAITWLMTLGQSTAAPIGLGIMDEIDVYPGLPVEYRGIARLSF